VEQIFNITPAARAKVVEVRSDEPDPEKLALWLEVSGTAGNAYTYDMWFQASADAAPDDIVLEHDDLPVVIIGTSAEKLSGATLDLSSTDDGGLVIVNPNTPPARPASPAMGDRAPADLSGPVATRVMRVLEEQINPAIAMHGGFAELVAVEEETAYLRLSGGCQGCGLAQVTLSQGIAVAITDAVPEITDVVDVTDHSHGANPFYEPAKK
jgi:Fe/S biogenesis protein NfuA